MRTRLAILAMLAALGAVGQPPAGQWQSMFDGKTLKGWKETEFTARGKVTIENGAIILGAGHMTGVTWTGEFPKSNYEVRLEAARLQGNDFFAGITFPVFTSFCSWINGGWNGTIVGLSSLDGYDASENETTTTHAFDKGRWYKLRLEVTAQRIAAWTDDELTLEFGMGSREVGLRPGEIELSKPFGIAAYGTVAGLRKIEYRVLAAE
jgi:3-keto-disaccharide hydrolase